MQATIEALAKSPAKSSFDDPVLRAMLEDHLTWLINHESTNTQAVTAHQVDVYDFDWIGLLTAIGVEPDLHWITIRMNGGMSLTDVPQNLRSVRVPSLSVVQNLISLSSSSKRIK